MYGGGPLPEEVGNSLVAEGVKLFASYGMTEIGNAVRIQGTIRRPEDWQWLEIEPDLAHRWTEHKINEETFYELLVIVRSSLYS